MIVKDIMEQNVEFVTDTDSVRKVSHLIFGKKINGLPVVKERKVIGFVTEKDILSAFLPTMRDLIEDPVRSRNFELMESQSEEILRMPVSKIMSKNPTLIRATDPIMKAESTMVSNKVGRLPVVDDRNHLIGIVTKGDIFKAVIGNKIPYVREESFFDWFSVYNDTMIDWKRRLSLEIPEISSVFRENKVTTVIDVASGTGEHSIALAKEGFRVFGIEISKLIYDIAEEKLASVPSKVRNNVTFINGNYKENAKKMPDDLDAAIFMGNALPFTAHTESSMLELISKKLRKKNAVIIIQMENLHKVMFRGGGTTGLIKAATHTEPKKEYGFLGFYTDFGNNDLTYNKLVFSENNGKWNFEGMSNTKVAYLEASDLVEKLKKLGFTKVNLYGGPTRRGGLFKEAFDEEHSDSLNIVAVRP